MEKHKPVWLVVYHQADRRNVFLFSLCYTYADACRESEYLNQQARFYVCGIIRATMAFDDQLRRQGVLHESPI